MNARMTKLMKYLLFRKNNIVKITNGATKGVWYRYVFINGSSPNKVIRLISGESANKKQAVKPVMLEENSCLDK